MIIDGIVEALLAHFGDEFPDDRLISRSYGARIGDHSEVCGLQIFEQNVAVEGQIELGLIQQMEDDDVVALEAELAQSFDNFRGLIEQIRNQHNEAAPLDLPGDLVKDLADVGVSGGAAIFQGVENLN